MKKHQFIFAAFLPLAIAGMPAFAESTNETTTKDYKVGDYIDDATITSEVKMDLLKDNSLKASNISVETTNGVVHLDGKVESKAQESQAVEIARSVKGVKAVREDLAINESLD